MSMYREELNKYKSKRIGQTDAKVVAPKGRKKKVDKPWCVVFIWNNNDAFKLKPMRTEFKSEHDARAYLRKRSLYNWGTVWLELNGEKIE